MNTKQGQSTSLIGKWPKCTYMAFKTYRWLKFPIFVDQNHISGHCCIPLWIHMNCCNQVSCCSGLWCSFFFVKSPISSPFIVVCCDLLSNTTVPWSFLHTALHVLSKSDSYLSSMSKEQGMVTQDPLRTSMFFGINASSSPHRAPETQDTNL